MYKFNKFLVPFIYVFFQNEAIYYRCFNAITHYWFPKRTIPISLPWGYVILLKRYLIELMPANIIINDGLTHFYLKDILIVKHYYNGIDLID